MPHKTESLQRREPLSLRQRLILALLTPLIVILTVSSYFDYRLAKKTANSAHDQSLADNVFDVEAHIKTQNPSFKLDLTEEAEAMLRSNAPDMLYFSVSDPFGKVVAGDADLPQLRPPKDDQVEFSNGVYRDTRVRIASHRITIKAQDFLIVVMETTKKREQASARILTAMVIPNLAVILATMLAVVLGVRQGLLPLHEVERDIAERSANDLHEIDPSGKPAEIRPMLRRLNELFALLRDSVEIQQRFIADAAHQLRTPLAGLQTQLDLANAEGAFDNNPERIQLIEFARTNKFEKEPRPIERVRVFTSKSDFDKAINVPATNGTDARFKGSVPSTVVGAIVGDALFVVSEPLYFQTFPGHVERDYEKLLTHELAHRYHQDLVDGDADAMGPIWFFEGFATLAADQYVRAAAVQSLLFPEPAILTDLQLLGGGCDPLRQQPAQVGAAGASGTTRSFTARGTPPRPRRKSSIVISR